MEAKTNRIQKDLETLAKFTATPGQGITRSSYSKEDTLAKEYLVNELKKLDLKIYEDGVGTIFGRKEGTLKDAPCVMFGSHYDSVVNGGAFDGAAGTVAAIEVMRILKESGFKNDYPMEVILMNAEEGATFGPSTGVTNSRAMVGTLTEWELDNVRNRFGQTKREAMKEYNLIPDLKSCIKKPGSIKNFVELHVEQGPVLDREKLDIGIINYLAGIGRYSFKIYGKTADSTAPMSTRKDALVAASNFIVKFDNKIKSLGEDVTGMVGKLDVTPNSNQFVPELCEGKIEIRTFTKEIATAVNYKELILNLLDEVKNEFGMEYEINEITRINYPNPTCPSVMNADNVKKMENYCQELGYSYTVFNKGTGHDSMIMTDFCDTNMIYVPSLNNGVSHCPEEWTDYEQIKKGADVLLRLIKDLSKKENEQ